MGMKFKCRYNLSFSNILSLMAEEGLFEHQNSKQQLLIHNCIIITIFKQLLSKKK